MFAGTDAGTGVRGDVGVWGGGILLLSPTVWAGSWGEGRDTHTHTHTQEHRNTQECTRECCMHPPFSDLPLKKCPKYIRSRKTDPVQFKGPFKQGPFAYKNGRFASRFLLLRCRSF